MLIFAALVCASIAVQPEMSPDSTEPIIFAAGRKDGNYYALAQALATDSKSWCAGCKVDLAETEGSYDNARRLRERTVNLALLQSDVAYLEFFEGRPYQAIATPFLEPVHIVVRRELGLIRLSELITRDPDRPFRVAIGPSKSGTASHARTVLHELETQGAKLTRLEGLSVQEGFARLRDRQAEVAFVTSAVPVENIQKLTEDEAIGLLEVDPDLARRLRSKNPFFSLAEIPYDAYPKAIDRNVATLATRVLLVVRKDFPEEWVQPLLDSLYRLGGPEPKLPFLRDLRPDRRLDDLLIPSHPQAIEYHRSHESWLSRALIESRSYLLPVAVLLAPLMVLLWLPRAAYFIHQFVLGRVLILLGTVWLVGSAAMHLLEGQKNSNFRSLGSSAVAILHYLFSGFETKFPITVAGHVVSILILSLGVAVVTLFTATVVTLLVERALNVRKIGSKPRFRRGLRNHVVLVGWSERTERVLQHLRNPDVRPRPVMVVASSKPPRPLKLSRRQLRGVWSVTSDQQRKTLERAELSQARIAVVLGEESSERSDWRATSSALAVDRVAPQVHTVVAVLGRSCCENLHSLRANEVVVTGTLGERLVSQCAITPGISAVYNELLTFGMGSQEVYLGPIPRPLGGKTFRDIRRELMDEEIVPVGYRSREGEFRVNPRADDRVLGGSAGEGWDELVFIADNRRALPGAGGWKGSPDLTPGSRKKGMTMPTSQKKSTSHAREATIGVCGWGSEARSVIEQLRESVIAAHQRFSVTVIDEPERLGFAETRNGDLHEHVRFVVGDPTRKRVLENAGLREFRSLVILADRSGDEAAVYSDHRALMIALSATALNPSLHIIVELLHSKNREHFEHMPTVEVVSVEELAEKLLAQAVVNPGITEVYLELLTATADSNEVYIVPVPAAWVGRSFRDVYADLLEAEEAMIPIGYRVPAPAGNGQVVVLNPGRKEQTRNGVSSWKGYELSEDDGLVVISYEQPDLATLAARLAEKA